MGGFVSMFTGKRDDGSAARAEAARLEQERKAKEAADLAETQKKEAEDAEQ
jgi:hypothetical protein